MTPDHIKPVEPNYVVAALVEDVHSLFWGRKPRRRDDQRKRARRFDPLDAAREDTSARPSRGGNLEGGWTPHRDKDNQGEEARTR
jgi:hypothetical protein